QGAEGPQEVADGAAADGQDGGQGEHDEAKEGGPGEGPSQGAEEGAGRLGYGLMDAPERAASGPGLARPAAAAFAVAAAGRGAALPVRVTVRARGGAAMSRGGYTGHRSLLGVNAGQLPSLHQVGSFFPRPRKKAEVELNYSVRCPNPEEGF